MTKRQCQIQVYRSVCFYFTIGKQIRDKKYHTFDEITFISNANEDLKNKINNG